MSMNWPTFFKRLISAVFFTAIMLLGLLYPHPYALISLSIIIHYLCIKEWFNIGQKIHTDHGRSIPNFFPLIISQLLGLVFMLLIWLEEYYLFFPFFTVILSLLVYNFFYHSQQGWWSLVVCSGLIYISFPISLLLLIHSFNSFLPLMIILLIWTNDTMAYLVGSFLGKTPFSKISPNKTWEGIIGGVVFTVLVGTLVGYFDWVLPGNRVYWILVSFLIAVGSIIGDLLESKIKRTVGIKDSGNIMPGHGGALDRFDSMLFVLPLVWVFTLFF